MGDKTLVERSDWLVADADSPLEINLDCGAQVKVWARPCGVAQCELQAEIVEPGEIGD